MSENIFKDWHRNKDEIEQQMITAGLTRETLEKINKWMEKNAGENNDSNE